MHKVLFISGNTYKSVLSRITSSNTFKEVIRNYYLPQNKKLPRSEGEVAFKQGYVEICKK
jgi:hypothetical protein